MQNAIFKYVGLLHNSGEKMYKTMFSVLLAGSIGLVGCGARQEPEILMYERPEDVLTRYCCVNELDENHIPQVFGCIPKDSRLDKIVLNDL